MRHLALWLTNLAMTPTFWGTLAGIVLACFGYYPAAGVLLVLVGCGGVGIALWAETHRDEQVWSWWGLWKALRHPSRWVLGGFFGHLPQAVAGVLFLWRPWV